MDQDPEKSTPPSDALATMPPALADIWAKFAYREIARGRRDVSHLVEATLQFLMDQNARALQPMVATLEQLSAWLKAIDVELHRMHMLLHKTSGPTLPEPYQRVTITLERKPATGGPKLNVANAGDVTMNRADVQTYHASMQKQRSLVEKALEEHTQALVGRRGQMADALRAYSTAMHASAQVMIKAAPPPPERKTRKTADGLLPGHGTRELIAAAPPPGLLYLIGSWLERLKANPPNPAAFFRSCYAALLRGYRRDPFVEAEDIYADEDEGAVPVDRLERATAPRLTGSGNFTA